MGKQQIPLLFCGSSHEALAKEVAIELNIPLGKMSLSQFPDGETAVEIQEDVRGRDVFILQSTAINPSFYLLELLIIIDALKRSSAQNIVAIIPYFGYCRQDRKDKPGVPITAKLVANMLMAAGITRLITFDLHAGQLEGFFEIPVDHFHCQQLLAETTKTLISTDCIIVAPDIGSIKVAEKMAKLMNTDFVIIEKQRLSAVEVKMNLIGTLRSKHVLIIDDMCSTASTLIAAAKLCQQHGAEKVVAAVTHGICTGEAVKKIEESSLAALLITNTVPSFDRFSLSSKIITLSIAPLIAKGIKDLLHDYDRTHFLRSL